MRILITNDDGIDALGLKSLADALCDEHEIFIVAPSSERSATAHAMSLNRPMKYSVLPNNNYAMRIAVDGTPADCVKLAVLHFLKDRLPDLVLSGINHSGNVGSEVIYSGTVAAALEGAYLDIPSIAISNNDSSCVEGYAYASQFIAEHLYDLTALDVPEYTVLNINYPSGKAKGVKVTKVGINHYTDEFYEVGENSLILGGLPTIDGVDEDTDVVQVNRGYITITAVTLDKNNYEYLSVLKRKINFE